MRLHAGCGIALLITGCNSSSSECDQGIRLDLCPGATQQRQMSDIDWPSATTPIDGTSCGYDSVGTKCGYRTEIPECGDARPERIVAVPTFECLCAAAGCGAQKWSCTPLSFSSSAYCEGPDAASPTPCNALYFRPINLPWSGLCVSSPNDAGDSGIQNDASDSASESSVAD